jgi:hypothetical protein
MKTALLRFFEECCREAEVTEESIDAIGLVVPSVTIV